MTTAYSNLYEITELQQKIMRYVDYWVHVEKSPIPKVKLIQEMGNNGEKEGTVIKALNGLLRLGYIRRAVFTYENTKKIHSSNNETKYVQLRRL